MVDKRYHDLIESLKNAWYLSELRGGNLEYDGFKDFKMPNTNSICTLNVEELKIKQHKHIVQLLSSNVLVDARYRKYLKILNDIDTDVHRVAVPQCWTGTNDAIVRFPKKELKDIKGKIKKSRKTIKPSV